MVLTIAERVALFNVLPPEGNILTLRTVSELSKQLAFTDKELKTWKIKQEQRNGGVMLVWDSRYSSNTRKFEISDSVKGVIVERLKALSNENKLRMEMLTLYEKFVEGTKEVQ